MGEDFKNVTVAAKFVFILFLFPLLFSVGLLLVMHLETEDGSIWLESTEGNFGGRQLNICVVPEE